MLELGTGFQLVLVEASSAVSGRGRSGAVMEKGSAQRQVIHLRQEEV